MLSATDITNFLACPHTATLKQSESRREIKKPVYPDPAADLLRKLGNEHELKYLNELKADGLEVAEIDRDVHWADGSAETLTAMQLGADAIYQGVFLQTEWGGRPDLGDHFKSGQQLSVQNRPTEVAVQD